MTETQIKIVQNSWKLVAQDSEQAGKLFYARLFEISPGVRPMFPEDTSAQEKKLTTMLSYVINKLGNLNQIIEEVRSLARRHVKYGATPAHYPVVGEALIWTLEKGLYTHGNPEVAEPWTLC